MDVSDPYAEEIAEELLYRTGRAVSCRNFQAFLECFQLPQIFETHDGNRLIDTPSDLYDIFDKVGLYYHKNDVADVVRTVVSSNFLDPTTIGATHVSQLVLTNGKTFRKPYPTYAVLRLIDGAWKVVFSASTILDAEEFNKMVAEKSKVN